MILLVDDEDRRMDSYVKELELENHDVHFESNIDDALTFFRDNEAQIELLILDVMMPAGSIFSDVGTEYGLMTGIAFYQKISTDHNPDIPTIIFTNVAEESLTQDITSKSTVFFYKKDSLLPFELEEKVREILTR